MGSVLSAFLRLIMNKICVLMFLELPLVVLQCVRLSGSKGAGMSHDSSATLFRSPLLRLFMNKNATRFRFQELKVFQNRSVRMFLSRSVTLGMSRNVPPGTSKNAALSMNKSATLCKRKCAILYLRPRLTTSPRTNVAWLWRTKFMMYLRRDAVQFRDL